MAILETIALVGGAIATVKGILDNVPDQTRAIVIEVVNGTIRPLMKVRNNFEHGGFGLPLPPERIDPFINGLFSVQSSGLLTGVEGSVGECPEFCV